MWRGRRRFDPGSIYCAVGNDADTDTYTNSDADSDSNAYTDPNSDSNAYTFTKPDSVCAADRYRHAVRAWYCDLARR
jgi:hypothetical protein